MATINFYLKESGDANPSLINLHYFCNSFRLKVYTGKKIQSKKWNKKKQCVRQNYTEETYINTFLNGLTKKVEKIESSLIENKQFTKENLQDLIREHLRPELEPEKITFYKALDEFFEVKRSKLSHSYLKSVTTLKNHLQAYEKKKRKVISFESLTMAFYELFTSYLLNDCNQSTNTVGTNISRLKYFLRWATKMGYNSNLSFQDKDFKAQKIDTQIIYLAEDELFNLYELDLTGNKKLQNVRDVFCFGCFTGLRFSDVSKVSRENVREDELVITVRKTREQLTVPLNDYAREILERNDFSLPAISNQKTNDYLKELGQLIDPKTNKPVLNEDVHVTSFKGSERIDTIEKKYNLITTHTARRTFVTLSLEKGMRAELVMSITGHESYKNFKRYIKLTDKVKKAEMKTIWNRKPEQVLKVV